MLLQVALFHSLLCTVRIWTQNCWTPELHVWNHPCIVDPGFLSPEGIQTIYTQLFSEKTSLISWKSGFRHQQTGRDKGKETLQPDPEITEWESPNPWDAQIGPAALPVIYPSSGRAGLRRLPLCRDTQGLFTFLSLTLILRPLKICILFSWNKDFYHEAATHPITFSTTWKLLERTLSIKFSASWIFCWASCQDVNSWSASKSAFNSWRIAVETISI